MNAHGSQGYDCLCTRMLEALAFLCDLIDAGHEPLPGCDAVNEARAILRAIEGE